MAELRYTEAVHDSTHHLPAAAAPAPSWAEFSHDQRTEAHPIGQAVHLTTRLPVAEHLGQSIRLSMCRRRRPIGIGS